MAKAMELLREVLPLIEEQAEQEGYGFASAITDPRDFKPDTECCSEQEIENWKKACEEYGKGKYEDIHSHIWADVGGGVKAHISRNPFGIGTYTYRDPEMCSLRDRIKKVLKEDTQHAES